MSYLIMMDDGRYVLKSGGWNHFVEDPREATCFGTKDEARDARPGHHRDMGGSGFKGYVRSADREIADYCRRHDSSLRF